jgi:hypothetical protein
VIIAYRLSRPPSFVSLDRAIPIDITLKLPPSIGLNPLRATNDPHDLVIPELIDNRALSIIRARALPQIL